MEVTTTASTARTYRLSLERKEGERNSLLDVSLGNKSPDDLTEIAVRSALFGEQNPLGDQSMGFMAEIGDPPGHLVEPALCERWRLLGKVQW